MKTIFKSVLASILASTAVMAEINYQGRLTEANGTPVTGTKQVSVSIYDSSNNGNLLYQEAINNVVLDHNGTYSFQFGSKTEEFMDSLTTSSEQWLELTIDNQIQSPRDKILAVPMAKVAERAPLAETMASRAESIAEKALMSSELAKAGVTFSENFFSEAFVSEGGYNNTISNNTAYVHRDTYVTQPSYGSYPENTRTYGYLVHQTPETSNIGGYGVRYNSYTINEQLKFVELNSMASIYNSTTSIQFIGTINYVDGTTQSFDITHNYGGGTNQEKVEYITPITPDIEVANIAFEVRAAQASNRISNRTRFWTLAEVPVDFDVVDGFFNESYEYKILHAFNQLEPDYTYKFSTITEAEQVIDIDTAEGQWFSIPNSANGSPNFRITYLPPNSTSEEQLTQLSGILVLRRAINN